VTGKQKRAIVKKRMGRESATGADVAAASRLHLGFVEHVSRFWVRFAKQI